MQTVATRLTGRGGQVLNLVVVFLQVLLHNPGLNPYAHKAIALPCGHNISFSEAEYPVPAQDRSPLQV